MKYSLLFIASIFFVLSHTACGSIINTSNQKINVASDPSEAKIIVDGQKVGKTPMTVTLARKDNHIIQIELEGYETEVITLNRETDGWFWGNCLLGGVIGMGIDAITGGMYELKPNEIQRELQQKQNISFDGDNLIIKVVFSPNPEWEKIGQLSKK